VTSTNQPNPTPPTKDVISNIALIERGVQDDELKLTLRALRRTAQLRSRLTPALFERLVPHYFASNVKKIADFVQFALAVKRPSDDAASAAASAAPPVQSAAPRVVVLPEVEVYWHLLLTTLLLDRRAFPAALLVADAALAIVRDQTHRRRRSLEPFAWRAERYAALCAERCDADSQAQRRSDALAQLRFAALRHDEEGAAVLLCIVLRSYLAQRQVAQAFKLLARTPIAADRVSASQMARLLYYQGRIKAVQLDYSEAHACLQQALRKAPRTGARGFRLAVARAAVVVQLLMGEVPERAVFTPALAAYLALARAMRVGDVRAFGAAVAQHRETFARDDLLTLVERLHHNVLKTGLRKINVSYARISLADVATRLSLESAADAEAIVAKAIRDGVIDAVIDHDGAFVSSRTREDVYSTYEPAQAFHTRIEFCLKLHDDALQAMRYPDRMAAVEAEQKERERADAEARELAASLEEDDGMDED
jgi:26S proteasome regulatory subunit N3